MKRPGKWVSRFHFRVPLMSPSFLITIADIIYIVSFHYLSLQQAQFYYSGQSRYIGIFTSQEKAAEAYEIVRKTLKSDVQLEAPTPKEAFEIARKRAYEAVGEVLPEHPAPPPPPPQTNNVPSVGV